MPENKPLPTLKSIHADLSHLPGTKRDEVLSILGVKLRQTFYDILNGNRKLNEAEKAAIANVYGKKPEEIDWQDEPHLVG